MATVIFCCGAECGIIGAITSVSSLPQHWNTPNSLPTLNTIDQRSGNRCYEFDAAGDNMYLTKNIPAGNRLLVLRFYLRIHVLPAEADVNLFILLGPPSSSAARLRISTAGVLKAGFSSTVFQDGPTLDIDTWYQIDVRVDYSGTTFTMDWQVDGNAQTQCTRIGQTPADITLFQIGVLSAGTTIITQLDDIAVSVTTGDYPLGAGEILGYSPNVDGTHAFDDNDFKYNNTTGFTQSAVDVYTYIDEVPAASVADYISQNVVHADAYIEVGFADLLAGATIHGVEVVSSHHASATGANTCTLKLNDLTTLSDVYALADFSNTTVTYHSKHYALDPTGNVWSESIFNGLLARWGYSNDVVAIPFLDAIMLEVDLEEATSTTTTTTTLAPCRIGYESTALSINITNSLLAH